MLVLHSNFLCLYYKIMLLQTKGKITFCSFCSRDAFQKPPAVCLCIEEASKPAQLHKTLCCFLLAMTNAITPEGSLK